MPTHPLRLLALILPALILLSVSWLAPCAWAHGGQYTGPGGQGRRAPGDPTPPPPPTPRKGPAPTTPGSGLPTTTGSMPDTWWGTWWGLNRWMHLPDRRETTGGAAPVTGQASEDLAPMEVDALQRELLVRQQIRPFLLSLLTREPKEDPEVRAAALIALSKADACDETLQILLQHASNAREELLVRETAALSVGLQRRSDPKAQLDGISLDLARMQLLELAQDEKGDMRTRAFALLSTGLLADQPYASSFSRDGRLVVHGLREVLRRRSSTADLPVAALVALSLQPPAGVAQALLDVLRSVVTRGEGLERQWTDLERAHAVTALARLRAAQWPQLLLRVLGSTRTPAPVARAACLGLAENADLLSGPQRLDAVTTLFSAEARASDNLSVGLGRIAAARMLHADLGAGSNVILQKTPLAKRLLQDIEAGAFEQRGFHVLALALSARRVSDATEAGSEFITRAHDVLRKGLASGRDPDLRSAFAVGVGLVHDPQATPTLLELVQDRNAGAGLRARAALALPAVGALASDAVPALRALLLEDRAIAPRGAAALALTFFRHSRVTELLIEELRTASSQVDRVQVAVALGQTRDPKALPPLMVMARDASLRQEVRALAIAAIGILADPEERPSLLRLSADANYVGRTDALSEAFSIL